MNTITDEEILLLADKFKVIQDWKEFGIYYFESIDMKKCFLAGFKAALSQNKVDEPTPEGEWNRDKVNAILSNVMRFFNSDEKIALRDKLIRRTPKIENKVSDVGAVETIEDLLDAIPKQPDKIDKAIEWCDKQKENYEYLTPEHLKQFLQSLK